ncbi:MAG: phosphotransferase, partial [Planctomycetota bacterium]
WIHGDLHLGNLMRRTEDSPWCDYAGGPIAVLLDFAEMRTGHWVEDAVYLERQHWGAPPEVTKGIKPVSMLARARRNLMLEVNDEDHRLADLKRAISAAVAPALLHVEGNADYFNGALRVLEQSAERLLGAP